MTQPTSLLTSEEDLRPVVPPEAPAFVRNVTARIIAGEGDLLPVSALPPDGTFPTGTAQWEKRNIAQEVTVFEPDLCIECGKCVLVCPHATIRAKVFDQTDLEALYRIAELCQLDALVEAHEMR